MNQFKNNEPEPEVLAEEAAVAETDKKGSGLITNFFKNDWMGKEAAYKMLPFFFFMVMIGMVYIGNRHFAEKNIRDVEKINKELKELKWEYMTTKAELMFRSKQTEVVKVTELYGLKESVIPPRKIIVNE